MAATSDRPKIRWHRHCVRILRWSIPVEIVAVAERSNEWRWQIRHNGRLIEESGRRFAALSDAIEDGKRHLPALWTGRDRPPMTRQMQRRAS